MNVRSRASNVGCVGSEYFPTLSRRFSFLHPSVVRGEEIVNNFRIVLVEDDLQISALLGELLIALGHEVCATTATETGAVAAAALHNPSLMLVDVHLQTGNGLSAMATILARTTMPHVFMTGGARRNFATGATVLLKPFGRQDLMEALNRISKQGRSHVAV